MLMTYDGWAITEGMAFQASTLWESGRVSLYMFFSMMAIDSGLCVDTKRMI